MCQCCQVRLHNVPVLTQSVSSTRTSSSFILTFAGRLDSAHQCLGKVVVSQSSVCPIGDITRCVPEALGGGLMLKAHDKVVGVPSDLAELAARNLACKFCAVPSGQRTRHFAGRRLLPLADVSGIGNTGGGGDCNIYPSHEAR
jgi:hypothetical protein